MKNCYAGNHVCPAEWRTKQQGGDKIQRERGRELEVKLGRKEGESVMKPERKDKSRDYYETSTRQKGSREREKFN